jgi:hypothetical protein
MEKILDDVEVRVVGSLIEKQLTTPEYYPLTLHALTNACNQKSNREPVVAFDEKTVARAAESLREKFLVHVYYGSESRVMKYKQMLSERMNLSPAETAIMCVLMLRGPQTPGEIRGRTGRLFEFADIDSVESSLESLMSRESEPLVVRLPRMAGHKEVRYAHLLTGEVSVEEIRPAPKVNPVVREVRAENERLAKLEEEFERLREEFELFKKQFE